MRACQWTGVCVVVLALLLLWALPRAQASAPAVPVVDLHVDLPYQVQFNSRTPNQGSGEYQARWLSAGGVVGAVMPLFVPKRVSPAGPQMQHYEAAHSAFRQMLEQTPSYGGSICRPMDSRVGVSPAFEGAEPLGDEPTSVRRWAARGVKLFGLVHSSDTRVAASSGRSSKSPDFGLTERGKRLVEAIHRVDGVVDVSHASDATVSDVLALARAAGRPVVATHSNSRSLAPHPRNLTDAQARAIAATGGVIGVNFHSRFLLGTSKRASMDDVVRHIQHLLRIAGPDHVALGSDFEGGIRPPAELADVRGFPKLAQALGRAGVDEQTVRKIFSRNALRVLCGPLVSKASGG